MTTVYLYGCRTQGTGGFYWREDRRETEQLRDIDRAAGCQVTRVRRVEVPRVRPDAITAYIDRELTALWDRPWKTRAAIAAAKSKAV